MITIIDYGSGNLGSIANMLKKLHIDCCVSSSVSDIESAQRIILPGVGTFDSGIRGIEERGLREVLDHKACIEKVPTLGICLGAQLMTRSSDEGSCAGLGWLPAKTVKFSFQDENAALPLPNIGWRDVEVNLTVAPFELESSDELARFYFVHKYHFVADSDIVWMNTSYGYRYPCALRKENLMSVQFHPEKSHRFGMNLLAQFAKFESRGA